MRSTGELVSGPEAVWIPLAVLALVAVLVVLFTRARLAYKPERAARRPDEAVGVTAQPRGP